jgi:hypothetical protein
MDLWIIFESVKHHKSLTTWLKFWQNSLNKKNILWRKFDLISTHPFRYFGNFLYTVLSEHTNLLIVFNGAGSQCGVILIGWEDNEVYARS